jgi:hypothetical protein
VSFAPAVASTFGPVMRFVYGADFAARTLSAHLSGNRGRSSRTASRRRSASSSAHLERTSSVPSHDSGRHGAAG